MSRRGRFWKAARDGTFALLGLAALGLAAFFHWHEPGERPVKIRLSAGRAAGERRQIADVLRREALSRSIIIELVDTAGSDDALKQIDAGRLDVALAQGALDLTDRPNLRQVATLHVEPLHLLVKEEIHQAVSARLSALRGKTIGLGESGSGTNRLATEVLDFAGLRIDSDQGRDDFKPNLWGYSELRSETDRDRLPDAVFMVSTLPAPVARHLVAVHRFRLVEIPFFEAFTLGAIDRATGAVASSFRGIDRRNLHTTTIPAFAYEVEPGVPPGTIQTLGTMLLLVANRNVAQSTIERLLDVVYASSFSRSVQPPLEIKQLDNPPELPWHDGTIAYLRRNAPIIAGDVVDLIEKELSIVGALIGGLFFLTQWLLRRYRKRRERGFEACILRVNAIERRAIVLERADRLDLPALLALQEELSALKGESLEKFVDGELDGEELMSSFLTHVADTRDFLTRLILHTRSTREEALRLGDVAHAPTSIVA